MTKIEEKNFFKMFCENAFDINFMWIQGLKQVKDIVSDITWIHGLTKVKKDDVAISIENSFAVVGHKRGGSKTKSFSLGVLFEYSEGDLKLRGLSKTAEEDVDFLLTLIPELFEKQNQWITRIIISGKPSSEWRKICGA